MCAYSSSESWRAQGHSRSRPAHGDRGALPIRRARRGRRRPLRPRSTHRPRVRPGAWLGCSPGRRARRPVASTVHVVRYTLQETARSLRPLALVACTSSQRRTGRRPGARSDPAAQVASKPGTGQRWDEGAVMAAKPAGTSRNRTPASSSAPSARRSSSCACSSPTSSASIKNVEIPDRQFEEALDGDIMFDGSSIEGFVRIEESDMYLAPDLATFRIFPVGRPDGREGRPDDLRHLHARRHAVRRAARAARSSASSRSRPRRASR